MKKNKNPKQSPSVGKRYLVKMLLLTTGLLFIVCLLLYIISRSSPASMYIKGEAGFFAEQKKPKPTLDKEAYDKKLLSLAHVDPMSDWYTYFLTGKLPAPPAISTTTPETSVEQKIPKELWPVKAAYPEYGALLPHNRILAYYGNFYSTRMGILGEFSEEEVLSRLAAEKANWEEADPNTPVIPAINYIAITAQGSAGADGKYRLRMPDSEIDKAVAMANKIDGIVILDIQIGFSTLQEELPLLEKYLALPNVHLGIDPEFSMKGIHPPGKVIGSFNADDMNYTIDFMSDIVKKYELTPKVLIIHRFTKPMVQGYKDVTPTPQVQVVIDMDGWGPVDKKIGTYNLVAYPEPIQFTGFKIFYYNDLKAPSTGLITPEEVISLTPAPSFIQYQ